MTQLDPDTKARIEAEERYRAQLRADSFPLGAWLGAVSGLLLAAAPFMAAFGVAGLGAVNFLVGNNPTGKGMVGVGIVVFLFALFPATRVMNIFTGFLSFLLTVYMAFSGGFSAFLQMDPQYGWLALVLGAIGAMTAGVLSAKPD